MINEQGLLRGKTPYSREEQPRPVTTGFTQPNPLMSKVKKIQHTHCFSTFPYNAACRQAQAKSTQITYPSLNPRPL